MIEKKMSSKTSKLRNFLVTGSVEEKEESIEEEWPQEHPVAQEEPAGSEECSEGEDVIADIVVAEAEVETEPEAEDAHEYHKGPLRTAEMSDLREEVAELKKTIAELTSQLERYTTTREQLKEYSIIMSKRDAELANRKFIGMLEQLSAMREDFFKLCSGINAKLDSFSPKNVLSSFEAYGVDMENILIDSGVEIGPSKFEKLNTLHQRIVDVIPTDDESMNGMIAERVSDGYVYQGRVLLKEKVKIYRFSENRKTEEEMRKNEQRIYDRN